jgi:Zn-dependent protease
MDKAQLIEVSCLVVIVILSLGIHEYGHALVAYLCGDNTAKREGRMTINPVAHIDPFMTILLPAFLYFSTGGRFMFGGAKPVPVDPRNLRHPLRDMMLVALAGPATNVVLAAVFMILWKASFVHWGYDPEELMPRVLMRGSFLNLALAVFNMLPIPPLDGSRVMTYILPAQLRAPYVGLERFGLLLVIVFIFFVPGVRESVLGAMIWMFELLDRLTDGPWLR